MGVTIREKDGAWWIFISHQGKRKAKRIGPGKEKEQEARKAAAKIQAKLVLGDFQIPDAGKRPALPLFKTIASEWERLNAPAWKLGTIVTYSNILKKHILSTFGGRPIDTITPEQVEVWWIGIRERHYSKTRLTQMRAMLHGIFQRAVNAGLILRNPADRIQGRLGRQDCETRRTTYLTRENLGKVLNLSAALCPREYPLHLVMATAGLRLGEVMGLQVGDLDAPAFQIHIRRSVRRGKVTSPKNGKGRVVDVPPFTMGVLVKLQEIRQAEAAVSGTEARWLFPSPIGEPPLCENTVANALRRAVKAASLPKIRTHDLRHTYATLAIQSGVALLTVSRQLGHASIATTADIYGHAVPGSNRAAADALEEILAGNHLQPPRNPAL